MGISASNEKNPDNLGVGDNRDLSKPPMLSVDHDGVSPVFNMNTGNYLSEEEIVPTVFKWDHGGRNVYITGTFNNWERQLPMHKSGNDFSLIFNLRKVLRYCLCCHLIL